ncbi:hypothetical protein ACIQZB_22420 [Streptomyces sp. NPDC097727]|uniref:hypothetical protein n=1 Tax=Streptomyces sp. NPDC097727 TaxID=3366092 RepID=UPI0038169E92
MPKRVLRRSTLALPLITLGLIAPLAPAMADEGRAGAEQVPTARAFTADNRAAKVSEVLKYCKKNKARRSACTFKIDPTKDREYATAVKSLGNAVVNCTVDPISVDRTVTLRTSSTDNIGGEISGSVTATGTVSATGEVSTGLANETNMTNTTPNLKEGPTSTNGNKTTVTGGAKATGTLTAALAFQAAFKATYSKSWTVDNTETTTYKTTVKPYDMLVFGASAAMRRVVGSLVTDRGKRITNIAVDSPSMVNSSTFVAQTYPVPDSICGRKRPAQNTAGDDDNTRSAQAELREVPAEGLVPRGTLPEREDALPPAQH